MPDILKDRIHFLIYFLSSRPISGKQKSKTVVISLKLQKCSSYCNYAFTYTQICTYFPGGVVKPTNSAKQASPFLSSYWGRLLPSRGTRRALRRVYGAIKGPLIVSLNILKVTCEYWYLKLQLAGT